MVELLYRQRYKVVLFKCHWFNTNPHRTGSIKRNYHLISVETNTRWYDSDPYILATMAKQVFYLDDPKAGGGWKVVQKMDHRNIYDIPQKEISYDNDNDDGVAYQESSSSDVPNMVEVRNYDVIQTPLIVDGVPPVLIDPKSIDRRPLRENNEEINSESDEENDNDLVDIISEDSSEDSDLEY